MRSRVPGSTSHPAAPHSTTPGLYRSRYERDACGVAFVVDVAGRRAHRIVAAGLSALCRMTHRGAAGADPASGDGAGIMLQIPDAYYREVTDVALPGPGRYATGLVFTAPGDG
ncbi:MAG: hypothetical protein ACRD0P_38600, partial [Stackebrandtia sp.]